METRLKLLQKAMEDGRLSGSHILVIAFLVANGDGEYPASQLSKQSKLSRATFFRVINHLIHLGYLTVEREVGRQDNFYRLSEPHLTPQPDTFSPKDENVEYVCRVLADGNMTGFSLRTSKRRLEAVAIELMERPGFSTEMLKLLYARPAGLWYTKDWRGIKGQSPTPENILATWAQLFDEWNKRQREASQVVFNEDGSVYL